MKKKAKEAGGVAVEDVDLTQAFQALVERGDPGAMDAFIESCRAQNIPVSANLERKLKSQVKLHDFFLHPPEGVDLVGGFQKLAEAVLKKKPPTKK